MNSGGLSHFSSEYGLAADNVKNFEVSWREKRYILAYIN
jgi:hypothetical protein